MMKKCKSGRHFWDDKCQAEKLEKCCNGYVRLSVAVKNGTGLRELDEGNLHPYNERGDATFKVVLIPEHATERIKLLRVCEPRELAKFRKNQLV
jgi:hypothetical protein